MRIERPALIRRLPSLRPRQGAADAPMPDDERAKYPEVAGDLAVLDAHLVPLFRRYDAEALAAQNTFRLQQVVLILGSATATICGTVQAATQGDATWLAWVEALLAA